MALYQLPCRLRLVRTDYLSGFSQAIEAVFPQRDIQNCEFQANTFLTRIGKHWCGAEFIVLFQRIPVLCTAKRNHHKPWLFANIENRECSLRHDGAENQHPTEEQQQNHFYSDTSAVQICPCSCGNTWPLPYITCWSGTANRLHRFVQRRRP